MPQAKEMVRFKETQRTEGVSAFNNQKRE